MTQAMLEETTRAIEQKLAMNGQGGSWCQAEVEALHALLTICHLTWVDRRVAKLVSETKAK